MYLGKSRPSNAAVDAQTGLCWLAGLLEGEGSFVKGPPSSPRCPRIQLPMTDCDVVERVARLFDRRVFRSDRGVERGYKPCYLTSLKGAAAVTLMRSLRPLMGARRRGQIDRALSAPHQERIRWLRPATQCAVVGCSRPVRVRALCKRHYHSWWKATRRGRTPKVTPVDAPPPARLDELPRETVEGDARRNDTAWLAGLLEGEGTFGLNSGYPRVSVQMCDRDVLERAAEVVGGASVFDMNGARAAERGWSPAYGVAVTGARAADLMRELRPFMGARRSHEIDVALAAYQPIRLTKAPEHCVVTACDKPHRGRGLCHKHYMKWDRDRKAGKEPRIMPLR